MNATATTTRQVVTDDLPSWTRNTYKGHGQPVRFYFWGTGSQPDEQDGLLVTSVTIEGTKLHLHGKTETRVTDVRTRIWISPAPAEPAKVVPQPRQAEKVTAVKATRPGRNAKLAPCHCGCKAQVKGLYKQGHDARHAGDVARKAIAAGADADLAGILAELPTEALRIKAAKMVASRVK